MTRAARTLTLLGVGCLAICAWLLGPASAAGISLPPNRPGVYVYDYAHIWSGATIDRAQVVAQSIRDRTQAQLAIVSWPSDDADVSTPTARADAITIMDAWGVGRQGVNDGLVVLFDMDAGSTRHGQIYVYAGRGYLERYLNEDEAATVVNDAMLPRARAGDLDAALLDGLARIDRVTQPGGNPDRGLQLVLNALLAALIVGLAAIVFGLFLKAWWERGRDAEVPLIDDSVLLPSPPPGLTPAIATVLREDGVNKDAFTSAMVDLGHRGLVSFQPSGFLKHHVDIVVPPEPLVDPNSLEARRRPLGMAEQHLAGQIRWRSAGGVLAWSKLKDGTGKEMWESFKKDVGHAAKAAGYFRDDPNQLTGRWFAIGIALVVAVVVFGWIFAFDTSEGNSNLFRAGRGFLGLPMLVAALAGIAIAFLSRLLAARTPEGARTLAMALAYRNTLKHEMAASQTVEEAVDKARPRLPWITTPDLLTVWAVAFGLKREIDQLIKQTMAQAEATGVGGWTPLWYSGSIGSVSNMVGSISTTAASFSGSGYGGGGSGGGGGAGGGF
jgi:uncharacterized membrane protein YgcG